MKNRILKVSLLSLSGLMLSFGAFAQKRDLGVWSIGPEIGAAFSNHGGDDDSEYKSGLVAGGFVTYSIRDRYAFTGKILLNQKGSTYKDGIITKRFEEDVEIKERLNYIEIPVLARVFFNREGTVRPNVFFGPSFGFLPGAQWKIGDDDYQDWDDIIEFDPSDEDSYKDAYGIIDFGLSLGLGLSIRVANEINFIIDTRYTYGLRNFRGGGWSKVNNQNVAVTAGLSFGIANWFFRVK
jgi:hypothetical protein